MTLKNRIRAIEGRVPRQRFHDMSHLTDQQLELIETCVGIDGHWDRDAIARLPHRDVEALLSALRSLSGAAYAQLREAFDIRLSPAAQARIDALRAT